MLPLPSANFASEMYVPSPICPALPAIPHHTPDPGRAHT
jgi:hypothetical protein